LIREQKINYLNVQRKKVVLNDIDIDSQYLEQVKSYNYLGSIVNGDNSIEEAIKERIALSNKGYYENQNSFKSKLLTKKTKLELYWIVATYAGEKWVMREFMKRKLFITERMVI